MLLDQTIAGRRCALWVPEGTGPFALSLCCCGSASELLPQLAEEFRHYSNIGGQVFISTHSPDFLNAIHLDELYCLVKSAGYTKIVRASDLPLVVSLCQEGDLLGSLWSQGILLAEASKAGGRRDEAHIPFGGALHEIPAG